MLQEKDKSVFPIDEECIQCLYFKHKSKYRKSGCTREFCCCFDEAWVAHERAKGERRRDKCRAV
jgi:hypothetical protein